MRIRILFLISIDTNVQKSYLQKQVDWNGKRTLNSFLVTGLQICNLPLKVF